jgi:hypothetical protein
LPALLEGGDLATPMSDHAYNRHLHLRPWTVKRADALSFVRDTHRRLPKVQGAMWCVSVRDDKEIVSVALVGWPWQEQTNDETDHLRVLRVAVKEGYKNACSMLYGAAWRAAKAMGVESMDTFTHLDEPGTSLRAVGSIQDGVTAEGEYDRPSRKRAAQMDAAPKKALVGSWYKAPVISRDEA